MYRIVVLSITLLLFMTSCGASKKAAAARAIKKSKLEQQYQQYKNTPYKYGGTDKRGFDCSGFIQTVYRDAFKVQLPRTVKEMSKQGKKVSKNALKIGDLLFFKPSRKYRHIGIFMGDNIFMHSSSSKGITKSKLDNPYWKKKYRFSRRILK